MMEGRSVEQQIMDIRNLSFVKRECEIQFAPKPLPTGWTDPCLPPVWTDPGHLTSVSDAQWRTIISFLDSRTSRGAKGEFADYFRVVSKTFREKADKMRKRLEMQQEVPQETTEAAVAWAVEHREGEHPNATSVTAIPLPHPGPNLGPMDHLLRAVDDESLHNLAASNTWHNHVMEIPPPFFQNLQAFRPRNVTPIGRGSSRKDADAQQVHQQQQPQQPQQQPKINNMRPSFPETNGAHSPPETSALATSRKNGRCSEESSTCLENSPASKRARLRRSTSDLEDSPVASPVQLLTGMLGCLARSEPLRARAAADEAAGKLLRARRKAAMAVMSQLERVTALRDECDVEEHRARYGVIILRLQSRLDSCLGTAVC